MSPREAGFRVFVSHFVSQRFESIAGRSRGRNSLGPFRRESLSFAHETPGCVKLAKMPQPFPIPRTIELLKACWETAEARVCREVGTKYHESNEEAITVLLCGELRQEFEKRNANRAFESAFASDLRLHFPRIDLK